MHTLLAIGAREVNTHGFVLDHSRLDMANLTDDEGARAIEAFTGGYATHLEDGLLAATAARRGGYRRTYPNLQLLTTTESRADVEASQARS